MLYDVRIQFQPEGSAPQCSTRLVEALSAQAAHNKAVAKARPEVRENLLEVKVKEARTPSWPSDEYEAPTPGF